MIVVLLCLALWFFMSIPFALIVAKFIGFGNTPRLADEIDTQS